MEAEKKSPIFSSFSYHFKYHVTKFKIKWGVQPRLVDLIFCISAARALNMSSKKIKYHLDKNEVLQHLEQLGYKDISQEQLDDFIKGIIYVIYIIIMLRTVKIFNIKYYVFCST